MKKVVRILLAILMVTVLVLGITACKSECEKGNHVWDEGTVTTTATCTSKGVRTFKCTVCDETRTETIDMIDHTPIDASVPATCTTAGTTGATKCSVCGTSIAAGTTIPAKGHDVTTWTPCENDETKHEGICTREGCGVKVTEAHTPNEAGTECTRCHATLGGELPHNHNFDETIVANVTIVRDPDCTEKGSKTVKCSGCDEVKTVEIPALGHDYTGVDWAPSTQVAGKHFRTCTREGCGYIERADHTPEVVKGTPATCTEAGIKDGSKCSACNAVLTVGETINPLGHTWQTAWQSNDEQHWHKCVRCDATSTKQNHDFGENDHDLVCTVCDTNRPGENYVLTYEIDGQEVQQSYQRLADAVAFIAENQEVNNVIINVNDNDKELEGLGVAIPSGLTITINLHGSTYIIVSDPVGSTGTETNGFQILAGSNITIQNGTITSQAGSGVKMLIQNYANLKLDGVTLDGRNLDAVSNAPNYTLSNNCGTVDIRNQSKIIAREENGVALDVWYNMGGRYPEGVSVTVGKTCTIIGVIEYGSAQADANLKDNATLSLPAGTYNQLRFTSNVTSCIDTGITIDNKALTANWGEWTTVEDHEPTCENEGLAERFCKLCGLRDTKPLAKTSHTMETAEYVGGHQHEGVCTVCGHTETVDCTEVNYSCTVCGRQLHNTRPVNVTIDTSQQGYSNADDVTSIKSGVLTVSFDAGTNDKNSPKYYTSGSAIRLYGGNTFTISIPEGSVITKITITLDTNYTSSFKGNNDITADNGRYNNNVWTGSADSVVFTISGTSGHSRIQTIAIEYTYVECNHFFDYNNGEITTKPGCTTDGEITYTCMDCGDATETETIPASHKLGELVPAKDPDCENENDGHVAYYECSVCHKCFEDKDANTEISDTTIAWKHDFEYHGRVEATQESSGKKAYNECKVCGIKFDTDGKEIEDFDNWGILTYECAHTTLVWKDEGGEHIHICAECEVYIADSHNPAPGNWEGTDQHVQKCTGGCGITCSSHSAQYATDYTVVDETYHAQVCADCNLVTNKHAQQLGDLIPTQDGKQHHKVCGHEGCNYATVAEAHDMNVEYIGGGQHSKTCKDCHKTYTENCILEGDDDACKECGRIVVTVIRNNNVTLPASEIIANSHNLTKDNVSVVMAKSSGSAAPASSEGNVRVYPKNTITISAPEGYVILQVLFTNGESVANKSGTYPTGCTANGTTIASWDWQKWTSENGVNEVVFIVQGSAGNFTFGDIVVSIEKKVICYHDNTVSERIQCNATCENMGFSADCWYCTTCGKTFTSEDCTALSTAKVTPATGHNYGELISARDGNCTDVAYLHDHYKCQNDGCNQYFDANKNPVEESYAIGTTVADGHDWSDWTKNNDGTHSRTCSYDVDDIHKETDNCGLDGDWISDKDGHWHACPTCGYIDEMYEHKDDNEDGICDTCRYNSNSVEIEVQIYENGVELTGSDVKINYNQQGVAGETVTFTIATDDYEIVSVINTMTEKEIVAENGVYSYTIDGDLDGITVNVRKLVVVNINVPENAIKVTINQVDYTVNSSIKVKVGTTLEISVTPKDGYEVQSISAGGSVITPSEGKYTVSIDTTMTEIAITAEVTEVVAASWRLATSDDLIEGNKFIIVTSDNKYVAGSDSSTLPKLTITAANNTSEESKPFGLSNALILELGSVEDNGKKWTLKNTATTDQYLYATNSTTLNSTSTTVGKWTISIANDGTATIISTASTTRQILLQNSGAFRNYATSNASSSTYTTVQLYVWG